MTAYERAIARGVTDVVHYTSEKGVMGAVMKGALLSRARVETDPDLEFVYEGVWERKDPEWIDHISLSVSRTNLDLFRRSRNNHPNLWWAVMSFDPVIVGHDGVVFTTTNNIYDVCERGEGEAGFEEMFKRRVPWGHYGSVQVRPSGHPENWTTHGAAEALYPAELSLEYLQHIAVPGEPHRRLVRAWCEIYNRAIPPVVVDPASFE